MQNVIKNWYRRALNVDEVPVEVEELHERIEGIMRLAGSRMNEQCMGIVAALAPKGKKTTKCQTSKSTK